MGNVNTFASVTFVPACEGGQARAGGTVGVSGTLRAVGGTPEVVGATENFHGINNKLFKLGQ